MTGILAGLANPSAVLLWVLFVVFIILTILMIYNLTKLKDQPTPKKQILISTGAFIVWVLALGGVRSPPSPATTPPMVRSS